MVSQIAITKYQNISIKMQVIGVFKHDFIEDKGTLSMQQTTWRTWTNWSVTCCFYASIYKYLCVVGARSHIAGKSRTHSRKVALMVEVADCSLENLIICILYCIFVFLPQSSCDVLAESLNQTYQINYCVAHFLGALWITQWPLNSNDHSEYSNLFTAGL